MFSWHILIASATLAIDLLFNTTAHAALESRLGGQAHYETDLNTTWLANANFADDAAGRVASGAPFSTSPKRQETV